MATKKRTTRKTTRKTVATEIPQNIVQNCIFTAEAGKVEAHTADAAAVLAAAAGKNADAIAEIARALQGTPGTFHTGIRIGRTDQEA